VGQVINLFDTFSNFIAGFGTVKDKTIHQHPRLRLLPPEDLANLYRGDWLSRKIVDIPAFDSCRAWRQWQAEKKDITQLEAEERKFGLQRKVLRAMAQSRLYGGAVMVLGVNQGTFQDELKVDQIKKGDLKFIHVVERYMIAAGARVRDITSPWFGEPNYYMRANVPVIPAPDPRIKMPEPEVPDEMGAVYIHPSRVIRMVGLDYPDIEIAPDAWGDSVLQPVYDAIQAASLVHSSISSMIAEAKLDIISVAGLTEKMGTEAGTQEVYRRFSNANIAKSVVNALLIDKDNEVWDRKQSSFEGLEKMLMVFMMICSGAADIPATRLLGRSPAGENSTGESDMRNVGSGYCGIPRRESQRLA
jgi:phage-related protein (TIGR01555 family)